MKLFEKKKDRYEEYPKVVYESRKVKKEILAYLKYLGCPSFRIILKDLGFTKDDTVYLYRDFMSFLYSVNDNIINPDNKMILNHGFLFEAPPNIVLKNINEDIKYHCVRSNPQDDGVWFDKYYHVKKYPGNREYTRRYSMYGFYSSLVKDDYKLNVSLEDGIYVYDNEDIEIIEKERELEEFLVSLDFPVKIDEVYKKICEIIGKDIDKYIKFKIEVSKKVDNNNLKKYNTTDIIELDEGELVKFGMTIDNKNIFVDENNNWSYKIMKDDGKTICYSLSISDGNLDYSVKDSDNKAFEMLFSQNLEDAKEEVEKVRTRVRSLLKK